MRCKPLTGSLKVGNFNLYLCDCCITEDRSSASILARSRYSVTKVDNGGPRIWSKSVSVSARKQLFDVVLHHLTRLRVDDEDCVFHKPPASITDFDCFLFSSYLRWVSCIAGPSLKFWICSFLSFCLRQLKIPKVRRRALVVAIPKPWKPVEDLQSYRPISLLWAPYKILEKLIYYRVKPMVDPLLPKEQAGFRPGKSNVEQVVLPKQSFEDSFEEKRRPVSCLSI